jgi:hypothetical protein
MAIEFNAMNNTIPLAYHFVLISSPSIYVVGNFLQYLSIQRGQVAVDIFIKEKKKSIDVFSISLSPLDYKKAEKECLHHFTFFNIYNFFFFSFLLKGGEERRAGPRDKKEKKCLRRREAPRLSPPNGSSLLVFLGLLRFFVFSLA